MNLWLDLFPFDGVYRRKVSILEKERQDFQSTVDALQEGAKFLNSTLLTLSIPIIICFNCFVL